MGSQERKCCYPCLIDMPCGKRNDTRRRIDKEKGSRIEEVNGECLRMWRYL